MQLAGSTSWRLSASDSQLLMYAVFARDAVALPVPSSPDVPPPAGHAVPDRTAALPDADRPVAAQQWLSWWRRLIAVELASQAPLGSGDDARTQAHSRIAARGRVFDPPTFASLQSWPALRTAVVATFDEAREWQRSTDVRRLTEHPEWALIREVAEDLIAERGVRPDQLDATVVILEVPGEWHYLARRGAVLCSSAVAADPGAARALLREVFGRAGPSPSRRAAYDPRPGTGRARRARHPS